MSTFYKIQLSMLFQIYCKHHLYEYLLKCQGIIYSYVCVIDGAWEAARFRGPASSVDCGAQEATRAKRGLRVGGRAHEERHSRPNGAAQQDQSGSTFHIVIVFQPVTELFR